MKIFFKKKKKKKGKGKGEQGSRKASQGAAGQKPQPP